MVDSIENFIIDMIDVIDPTVIPVVGELGLKAHIGDVYFDSNKTLIQIYAQSVVNKDPSNKINGYTDVDIRPTSGIVVGNITNDTAPYSYIGEVLTIDDFVKLYKIGNDTKELIYQLMEKLVILSTPTEAWMSKVNSLYNDRIVGDSWIMNEMVMC